jgi:prepilin-type processing-associated H-X9-DG protein
MNNRNDSTTVVGAMRSANKDVKGITLIEAVTQALRYEMERNNSIIIFGEDVAENGGVFRASSNHRGGVNCLFMDGATKFISSRLDLRVWRGLATRAGGERISDNQY